MPVNDTLENLQYSLVIEQSLMVFNTVVTNNIHEQLKFVNVNKESKLIIRKVKKRNDYRIRHLTLLGKHRLSF